MIDSKELRIGNIFFDKDNTPCYFAGAWQRNDGWIFRDSAGNTYKESELYPIPLTPDILSKIEGFEMPSGVYELNDEWFLYKNYDGFWLQIEKQLPLEYICERYKLDCQYLHQLQNLIYTLTNMNLIINNI